MYLEIKVGHFKPSKHYYCEPFRLIELEDSVSLQDLKNKFKAKKRNLKRNTQIINFSIVDEQLRMVKKIEL
jgi:hypothetical protein